MPTVTLNFSNDLNVSLQSSVGDMVYYQTNNTTNITKIGECTAISGNSITCNIDNTTSPPANGDFIFFAKDSIVNTSGIIGYHADIKMEATSSSKKELYAVNSEIFISS
jgi:hypothetical protein